MTEKLQKCRSRDFAKYFVDRWMNENLGGGELSMTQVKNTISDFLDKNFGQWKYVLIVYPPHHGGHKHWTNYDIKRFRHHGYNIVLHFLPPSNSKACKDPPPIKWCGDNKTVRKKYTFYWGRLSCTQNNQDAHKWYNRIKKHPNDFGHLSALTVFQGKNFALKAQNVCEKILSIKTGSRACMIRYCDPIVTAPLTIIYA